MSGGLRGSPDKMATDKEAREGDSEGISGRDSEQGQGLCLLQPAGYLYQVSCAGHRLAAYL